MIKIVADENIPLVDHYFGTLGEILLKPGRDITKNDLLDATILLVRSVTKVDQALLQGTAVKFVGSATTGADHIDTIWLNQAGILWSVAAGCNSRAVVNYVVSVIAALQKKQFLLQKNCRAGVIGVGTIGSEVAEILKILGFQVLLCDPFRSLREKDFHGYFLEELSDLDFITIHTPLTDEGTYPTYHLVERHFLQRQKKNSVLLNTSRGSVVNFADLKQYGKELIWCFDVWENEPMIDLAVLGQALIATPHIAGYSMQSKYRGIEMIYHAAIQQGIIASHDLRPVVCPLDELSFSNQSPDWRDAVLAIYDPFTTTQQMKKVLMKDCNAFDILRKNFTERHEFRFVDINKVK